MSHYSRVYAITRQLTEVEMTMYKISDIITSMEDVCPPEKCISLLYSYLRNKSVY